MPPCLEVAPSPAAWTEPEVKLCSVVKNEALQKNEASQKMSITSLHLFRTIHLQTKNNLQLELIYATYGMKKD